MQTTSEYFSDPLVERYASKDMLQCFSQEHRYRTWRRVWLQLAIAQKQLGLPITPAQIAALRKACDQPIDFKRVATIEAEVHHDVMAHLHAFGEAAPEAKGILHLGATSAFVTDNADGILHLEALELMRSKLRDFCRLLGDFCYDYREVPTVGFTHFQVALPTTVGKRAALWLQDFVHDGMDLNYRRRQFRLRGAKGTTGTQASFLKLFDGEDGKVSQLELEFVKGFAGVPVFALTGQTYPRKADTQLLAGLSSVAESAAKMATDIRLLAHMREVEEPFGKKQVGSSAMPFKRNPILSERIVSLARLLPGYYQTAFHTSANQWLERSLDDSAARRMTLPRAFLVVDAILGLCHRIIDGIQVHEDVIERNLEAQLPFLLTEMFMMEGVKAGDDRQELHEVLRNESMAAFKRTTEEGKPNDLLDRLAKNKRFEPLLKRAREENWKQRYLVGRAPQQVETYVHGPLQDFLKTH